MTLKDIQKRVDDWVQEHTQGYFKPHEILARLTEENGELAREINHVFGPKKKKDGEAIKEIGDEIGDMVFTLMCLANSLDIDLDERFDKVMDKCYGRDLDRYKQT